jgi:RimJ/RimL family protein N-acetyltransferase
MNAVDSVTSGYRYFFEAVQDKIDDDIKLVAYDKAYRDLLSEDDAELIGDPSGNSVVSYGIKSGEIIVGVFYMVPINKTEGIHAIGIVEAYRGKGILNKVLSMGSEKCGIDKIYASINTKNATSIKAHTNIGFEKADDTDRERLIENGYMELDDVLYYKWFNGKEK